ncbi:MFS transporter [Sphingorhabdus lutea]|uniref:MFS transporter n=1 Tax=Sphingorhabdus lutea TaxID=1913578 RepID=A0A1L3JCZ1_9SPHN|nr:MFS transporter [Sphingorhabdus lutea]APG63011.1 MFS transporter [Sphingorhabdus lutea]
MTTSPHPFTIPNFRAYWFARLASMLALYSMMLILNWQAYNIARETMGIGGASARLGLIGLLQFAPLFVLTPLVGWVADRMDRRLVARIVLAGQAGIAALLAYLTYMDALTLGWIYGLAILMGIARAFIGPAFGALAPNLVPKESLPTAIAISTIAWQAGMLIGPAMAGPLFQIYAPLPYMVSTILYLLSLCAMLMIGEVPRSIIDKGRGPIAQIADGMKYVWHNKLVLGVITLDLFAVFLAGSTALIPVFARDILQVGADGLSWMAASPAAGALIIASIFSFRPIRHNVGNKMLGAVFIFGAATIIFGFSQSLILSMLCLMVAGGADMFSVYVRGSLIQLNTPDDKRGRVGAVSQLTISASNELGDAFSGGLAAIIGPVAAVISGGAGALIITAAWMRVFPQIGAAKNFNASQEVLDAEPEHTKTGDKE